MLHLPGDISQILFDIPGVIIHGDIKIRKNLLQLEKLFLDNLQPFRKVLLELLLALFGIFSLELGNNRK